MVRSKNIQKITPSRLERWDKSFLWHPFTQHYMWDRKTPLVIESGRGARLKDIRGRSYWDGVSSLWVNLWGHRHPVLDKALRRQISKISHSTFLGLTHPPAILLARKLAEILPPPLKRSFFSDNGATAVEVALKMAFQYWIERFSPQKSQKQEFLAIKGSYHGDTIGSVSVGGIGSFHGKFKPLLFKTHFVMSPNCYKCPFNKKGISHRFRTGDPVSAIPKPGQFRPETGCRWECLKDVESVLKKKAPKIAAGIIEPVIQGAAGMAVMPPGYLAGFARLLSQYNVLLIADEVATGFGRTGSLFAFEQEKDVRPDLVCLAKALTGGYSPLAVTVTTEKIFKAFYAPVSQGRTFFHGHSYTAHPLGCAVSLANIDLIQSAKLLEKSRHKAHLMKRELIKLEKLPHVGSIRQAGLMAGVELVKNRLKNQPFSPSLQMGNRVCQTLLKKGIWVRPLGDTIVLMPPPIIPDYAIKKIIRSLKDSILHECQN